MAPIEDLVDIGSRLPYDLERLIFEQAAISDPACASSLLQTARRVQAWIEPLAYTTLVLGYQSPGLEPRLAAALHTKPPEFFERHVRNVFIGKTLSDADTELVVSRCTGASSIVFEVKSKPGTVFPNIYGLPLQRLTLSFILVRLAVLPNTPIFPNLTHLNLYHSPRLDAESAERYLAFVATLPALSHLVVCMVQDVDFLRQVLIQCLQLQVLLHVFDAGCYAREDYIEDMESLKDPRCVLLDLTCDGLDWAEWLLRDWKLGIAGGADLLARASIFVEKKQKGIPIANHFLWDDPDCPVEEDDSEAEEESDEDHVVE
ncbi:hypothetical protein C8F01DRAFT_1374651 [Mycena amicta]|nr:hypothetical protein C8F01DRAFT_1374651 [Mycena amicta]